MIKIDESNVKDHHYLALPEDECFYLKEYKSGVGYKGGDTNSLILNFKKELVEIGSPQFYYREKAKEDITSMLVDALSKNKNIKHYTFVPIPPSKAKTDPLYEPRLLFLLRRVSKKLSMSDELSELDIRELLFLKESMKPSHKTGNRLTKDELKKLIFVDDDQLQLTKKIIILFDDVLTTGAHFKACKELLKEKLPDIRIIGLFIARTIRPLQCD